MSNLTNFYLDKKSNILFVKTGNNYYEPFAVDYKEETGECRVISKDPILMEVYEYINFFQRKRNNRGKYVSSPIFPYQWSFIFRHVLSLLNRTGETDLESYSRQLRLQAVFKPI